MITGEVKGIKSVIKDLERFGKVGSKEVSGITKLTAQEMAANAKAAAPSNFGKLKQSITEVPIDPLNYKVVVYADYGAYVEFGTGVQVEVPAEMKDVAAQFRGGRGGSFEEGLQSIKDWCRSKGIPEEAAYPIFMSILNKGIRPQPYLYPAFVKGRTQYLKD